jgi:hypothetical protein
MELLLLRLVTFSYSNATSYSTMPLLWPQPDIGNRY